MLLGTFHFDNPGLDAVKYTPIDVMQPEQQAYVVALSERLARFAPTKVLLEYTDDADEKINQRYRDYLAGKFELRKNEVYQVGFRVAKLMGHKRVYGFDAAAPAQDLKLWDYLSQEPAAESALNTLIETESRRLQELHRTKSLQEILTLSNSPEENQRNKGFYMLLNPVGAKGRLFHGADASADWWHRNLRMYAIVQQQAAPGERVLAIAGSGHVAVMHDFLRRIPSASRRTSSPISRRERDRRGSLHFCASSRRSRQLRRRSRGHVAHPGPDAKRAGLPLLRGIPVAARLRTNSRFTRAGRS